MRTKNSRVVLFGTTAVLLSSLWISAPVTATAYECHGELATIVGTEGEDRLEGTDGVDVIVALGGDDEALGHKGNDIICGGPGDDYVGGNRGDDLLYGGSGEDILWSGQGDDEMVGGPQDDRLTGRGGNDRLEGGSGADELFGGAGADELHGGWENDELWPDPGGPEYDDDVVDGGYGEDWVLFSLGGLGVEVDLTAGTAIGHGSDTLVDIDNVRGTFEADRIYGDEGRNEIYGWSWSSPNNADDWIEGRGGADELWGQGVVLGQAGSDVLQVVDGVAGGGAGMDRLETPGSMHLFADLRRGEARYSLDGTPMGVAELLAIETIIGGNRGDLIYGDGDSNTLIGRRGNDELYGRAGDDELYGEGGYDTSHGGRDDDLVDGGPLDDIGRGGFDTDTCIRIETAYSCEQ